MAKQTPEEKARKKREADAKKRAADAKTRAREFDAQFRAMDRGLNNIGKTLSEIFGIKQGASITANRLEKGITDELKKQSEYLQTNTNLINDGFKDLMSSVGMYKEKNKFLKGAEEIQSRLNKMSDEELENDGKILRTQKLQLVALGKIQNVQDSIGDSIEFASSKANKFLKDVKKSGIAIASIVGLLSLTVKRFLDLEALNKDVAQSSGLLLQRTTEFNSEIKEVQPNLIAFGASMDDIAKASATTADNFGFLGTEQAKIVSDSIMLGKAFGVSAETLVDVTSQARLLGASTNDVNNFLNTVVGTGVQVNKVFEDLKGISGDTAMILAGQTDLMMQQVLESRRIGLNLNDIANASAAGSSFQDMFTNGMKATILFGRQISLLESTRLRRAGKFNEARRMDLEAITGETEAIKQRDKLATYGFEQKKLFQDITGRNIDEEIKALTKQAFLQNQLTGQEKLDVKNQMDREKLLNQQLRLQDKFNGLVGRVGVKLGEILLPKLVTFVDKFEAFLNDPQKVDGFFEKMDGYIQSIKDNFKAIVIAYASLKTIGFLGKAAAFGVGGGLFGGTNILQGLGGGKFTPGKGAVMNETGKKVFGAAAQSAMKSGTATAAAGTFQFGKLASFFRLLGPAFSVFSIGADIFKATTSKEAKIVREATGGAVGGVVGAVIGGVFGGPVGVVVGQQVGKFAGKAISSYFKTDIEQKQEESDRIRRAIDGRIVSEQFDRQVKLSEKIKEIELKGATTRQEILDKVYESFKGTNLEGKNFNAMVNEFFQFDEKGNLKTKGKEFLDAIDSFKTALNDQATIALNRWAEATKLTADSMVSSELLKMLDEQDKKLKGFKEGALIGNQEAMLSQFGFQLEKLFKENEITKDMVIEGTNFSDFRKALKESDFKEAEKVLRSISIAMSKVLGFDASTVATQNLVKELARQSGLTDEQMKNSEALASIEGKNIIGSRTNLKLGTNFLETTGIIDREKLSESISKAFGLFQEQIKQERLEEETRILSSEVFIEKIDELIRATEKSKVTIGDKEISNAAQRGNQLNN